MNVMPGPGPASVQDAWTLAVDLGCAQVAAAVTTGGGAVQALEFDAGQRLPGGVWMDSDGLFVTGTAALRQALLAPQRWEPAPVRLLGSQAPQELAGSPFEPVDAVAQVLGQVLQAARDRLGRSPERSVLICPETWDAAQREDLAEAGRRGGLSGVRILGAAQATGRYLYAARLLAPGQSVAFMDVGAGSVSTGVIRRGEDGLDVLGAAWTDGLGGNSLDALIFQRVVRSVLSLQDPRLEAPLLDPPDARWRRLRETLMREVRRAREELTRHGTVRVHTNAVADASLELTRHDLDLLIRPQIDQMVAQLGQSLAAAGVPAHSLDGMALLGGAGGTPLLARAIVASIGQLPRLVPDPQLALAFGGLTGVPAPIRLPVPSGRTPGVSGGAGGSAGPDSSLRGAPPTVISPRASDASPAGGLTAIPFPAPSPEPATEASSDPAPDPPCEPAAGADSETAAGAGSETAAGAVPETEIAPDAAPVAESGADLEAPPDAAGAAGAGTGAADPDIPRPGAFVAPDPETLVPAYVARRLAAQSQAAQSGTRPTGTAPSVSPARAMSAVPVSSPVPVRGRRPRTFVIVMAGMIVALLAGALAAAIRPSARSDASPGSSSRVAAPGPSAPPSPAVDTWAAAWGDSSDLARTWSAVVPVSPAITGSQGQECRAMKPDSPYSIHKILCTFPNGVRMSLLGYATRANRDRREQQIAAVGDIERQVRQMTDLEGDLITGILYTDVQEAFRWWALEDEPHAAVSARWPGHTPAQLATWWDKLAPFT